MANSINNSAAQAQGPKKRVLFVITRSELGGAQRFLVETVKHLDGSRYEVFVAAGAEGGPEIEKIIKSLGVDFIILKYAKRNISPVHDLLAVFELRRLIKKLRPDVLFLNSSKTTVWGPVAVYFPRQLRPRPRVIYRIGGWSFNDPRPFYLRWLWILIEKIFAGYKDVIIVNNRHDFEQAKRLGIRPRHKLELVYNGMDPYKLELLKPDEAKIRLYEKLPANQKHAGILQKRLVVGTIANFYKTKGLNILIETAKMLTTKYQLPTTNFVIIGDGPERENLELLITKYQLQNKVILAGRLLEAYKYLPAFDIFVLPSVKEGFPWALLEAMSAKVPVIAAAVGAVPEIIETNLPGKNGLLVPPADPQAMAEAIAELAVNERLRQELAIQAHQTVLHKFPINKMVEQIEALL